MHYRGLELTTFRSKAEQVATTPPTPHVYISPARLRGYAEPQEAVAWKSRSIIDDMRGIIYR